METTSKEVHEYYQNWIKQIKHSMLRQNLHQVNKAYNRGRVHGLLMAGKTIPEIAELLNWREAWVEKLAKGKVVTEEGRI